MVDGSRETHERFATVVSAAVAGLAQARRLLVGNAVYLGYLDRGLGLMDVGNPPWQIRETAVAALLRCCMAPAGVGQLLAAGYRRVGRRDVDFAREAPDRRVAAFERVGGPASWAALFAEVAAVYPDRGGERGGSDHRDPPEDPEQVERLRRFEEEVMLRRCYEHAAAVLDSVGLSSIGWAGQEETARSLKLAVGQVDAELAERLNVVTQRRPVLDDALEFDRQKIRLRDRVPVELVEPGDTLRLREAFEFIDPEGDRYVSGVWLRRDVAAKQFAFPAGTQVPDPVVALVVAARTGDGSPVVRMGLLPSLTTPRQCQDALGDVPLVVLTSHLTLTDPAMERVLRRVEPVFVVMDLPVAWHVDDWIRQGAKVRFGLTPLTGIGSGELWLAVFAVDRAPGFRFLSIGGKVGVSLLVERLRQRHGERLAAEGGLLRTHAMALNLAVGTVLSTWHVLDQDALT